MEKAKFNIYVEDYNIPLNPWYILNNNCFKDGLKKILGFNFRIDNLFLFEKNKVTWGPIDQQFVKIGDIVIEKIKNDPNFLTEIIQSHYNSFEKIKNFCQKLEKTNLKSKSNSELFTIYNKYYQIYAECWNWGLLIQLFEMGAVKFSDRIFKLVKRELEQFGNSNIVFSKLIAPIKETYLNKEGIAILKMVQKIQEDKLLLKIVKKSNNLNKLSLEFQNKLKQLSNKFGWMQYYYLGPAAQPEYYYDLLKLKLELNAKKEIEKYYLKRKELESLQNKIQRKLNLSNKKYIESLREFSFLKEMRKEVHIYYFNYHMHKWYLEVARRFYWSPLRVKYITKDEFKKILVKKEMVINEQELNDRYLCLAYLLENNKEQFYSGKKAQKYKNSFIYPKIDLRVKKLEGNIAYPGKTKGIVKIVNSIEDLIKFNQGDILVSFSTNPSLVPAMNKASAIITNTGGITCHAAIVSRELKIPCVIGTKIATKVLKDGDLVEVDANKGIVRKI